MAQASGSRSQIIYDQETVFKSTPGSPDAKLLPFKSETLRLSRELVSSEAITSARNPKTPRKGKYEVGGSIELEINPYLGVLFKHALGVVSTTGAGPYAHTIKVGALPIALCIEKGFVDIAQYFLYNGCRANKLAMAFAAAGIVTGSVDVLGAKETVSGSSFDATPADLGHNPFDNFEASIQEGGSAIAIVTECDFALENNLDGDVFVIGGAGERNSLPEGMVKVSGTLKALFESLTLYNKAKSHTESSLKITLSRGDGLGSAGNESLEIFIPELIFKPEAPVIPGPKGILVELPYEAFYDNSAEASTIQMILKNTVATL